MSVTEITEDERMKEFDMISIGGGSGIAAANRNAAMHGARVAVVEGNTWREPV